MKLERPRPSPQSRMPILRSLSSQREADVQFLAEMSATLQVSTSTEIVPYNKEQEKNPLEIQTDTEVAKARKALKPLTLVDWRDLMESEVKAIKAEVLNQFGEINSKCNDKLLSRIDKWCTLILLAKTFLAFSREFQKASIKNRKDRGAFGARYKVRARGGGGGGGGGGG